MFFGNPLFNDGADQKTLLPTLNHLSFSDQQSPRANRRLDVAYGADNIFAWFLPNKWGGDHDLKVGVSYMYSSLRTQDFGNLNGTFTIPSDLPFNRADPRTYPERLSIRVGGPLDFLMKGHFIGVFVQDKWRPSNRLTVSVGARYDVEITAARRTRTTRCIAAGSIGLSASTPTTSRRASASPTRWTTSRGRRSAAASACSTSARRSRS